MKSAAAIDVLAGTLRAQPVAGPLAEPLAPGPKALAAMSARELIGMIARHAASSTRTSYGMGLCYQELSKPARYQRELGFSSFEELLTAHKLPTRVTAHKLITVVAVYSEKEVERLGGIEKSYALIRYIKAKKPNAAPRTFLGPAARVLGKLLSELTAKELSEAARPGGPSKTDFTEAKKVSSRLGGALRRAGLKPRMRVHRHGGPCVSVHLTATDGGRVADMFVRLNKIEKKK